VTACRPTSSNVARAKSFVDALQARGGTEMVPPMKAALTDRNGKEENRVRQVVFLTDGEVGNEQQLFDTISAMRGARASSWWGSARRPTAS
jgi:Ca-activated chloride channel family protein